MAGNPLQRIPSLERMLQREDIAALIAQHGRTLVLDALRTVSQSLRARLSADSAAADRDADQGDIAASLAQLAGAEVAAQTQTGYRPVFNLTGTVLHTNLGRAVLPRQAVQALMAVAGQPAAIEFDLAAGGRGNRDEPVEALLMRLTGAEAATVVNNNAAAVLLSLNTLAAGREVIVSRGELVEIGGAFRMPEIMASAGCQLREVGTTNRTHLHDYADAIGPATAALMTVHPSNYQIQGFTSRAAAAEIATLAHQRGLPLIDDLGSGSLISLKTFGLPHEPTVSQALAAGADVVTFSGDKLLGGPQCGLIVGRADLIDRIRRNPMKRALRVDKLTLAALDAVLRLYLAPERLTAELPALRQLTRELTDIQACAARICAAFERQLGHRADYEVVACHSQIGSGALPLDGLPSAAVAIAPRADAVARVSLAQWADALRRLPVPVLGRLHADRLLLDVRTLEQDDAFIAQLADLDALLGPR